MDQGTTTAQTSLPAEGLSEENTETTLPVSKSDEVVELAFDDSRLPRAVQANSNLASLRRIYDVSPVSHFQSITDALKPMRSIVDSMNSSLGPMLALQKNILSATRDLYAPSNSVLQGVAYIAAQHVLKPSPILELGAITKQLSLEHSKVIGAIDFSGMALGKILEDSRRLQLDQMAQVHAVGSGIGAIVANLTRDVVGIKPLMDFTGIAGLSDSIFQNALSVSNLQSSLGLEVASIMSNLPQPLGFGSLTAGFKLDSIVQGIFDAQKLKASVLQALQPQTEFLNTLASGLDSSRRWFHDWLEQERQALRWAREREAEKRLDSMRAAVFMRKAASSGLLVYSILMHGEFGQLEASDLPNEQEMEAWAIEFFEESFNTHRQRGLSGCSILKSHFGQDFSEDVSGSFLLYEQGLFQTLLSNALSGAEGVFQFLANHALNIKEQQLLYSTKPQSKNDREKLVVYLRDQLAPNAISDPNNRLIRAAFEGIPTISTEMSGNYPVIGTPPTPGSLRRNYNLHGGRKTGADQDLLKLEAIKAISLLLDLIELSVQYLEKTRPVNRVLN
jgi:hypothetical protein